MYIDMNLVVKQGNIHLFEYRISTRKNVAIRVRVYTRIHTLSVYFCSEEQLTVDYTAFERTLKYFPRFLVIIN